MMACLNDVSPCFTGNYRRNSASACVKLFSHFSPQNSARMKQSDFPHDGISQYRLAVTLSFLGAYKPSFFHRVSNIISACSEKKMVWVYARSIVAFVTRKQSLWNWTVSQNPRHAMSLFLRSTKRSISEPSRSRPFPAIIWTALIYFFPESFLKRSALASLTNQKMQWITAVSKRAIPRNFSAVWNRSIGKFPCHSVSHNIVTFSSYKHPIPVFSDISRPRPAAGSIGPINTTPKSFFNCLHFSMLSGKGKVSIA